jgi:ligand-binding sensor domain-containing protein
MKRYLFLIASIFVLAFSATPDARAQWVQTSGPYSGNVTCFASTGGYLFAGTWDGRVFRSSDSGHTWTAVNNGLPNQIVFDLAVSGRNLFVGTFQGIYVSTDNGTDWNVCDSGLTDTDVRSLAVMGSIIFAGTLNGGVFISSDSGRSWQSRSNGFETPYINSFGVIGSNILACASGEGLYLSTDSGSNWQWETSGRLSTFNGFATRDSELFAISNDGWIFISTDSGVSWKSTIDSSMKIAFSIAVKDSAIFVGTYDAIFLSIDDGAHWRIVDGSIVGSNVQALFVDGTNLLAGSQGGVCLTTNGGTGWVESGVPDIGVTLLTTCHTNLIATTVYGGGSLSTDEGSSWNTSNYGFTNIVSIGTSLVGAARYSSSIYLSVDSGKNWTSLGEISSSNDVFSLGVDGPNIFVMTDIGFFLSTDTGKSWTADNSGLTTTDINIFAIDGSYLFAAGVGVFISTNEGTSWTQVYNGYVVGNPQEHINVLTSNNSYLFAGTLGRGAFRSSDNGITWSAIDNGLTDTIINSFAAVGSNIFVGTGNSGVFLSTDNGESWLNVSGNLTDSDIESLVVLDSTLFVGTGSSGVWGQHLSDFPVGSPASVQTTPSPPQMQSYPNPFTQSTTVTFSSQAAGYAEVTVVNLLGAQVAQLFSGELSAGEHWFMWDAQAGSPVPRGMYECIVRMNGQVQRVGMMLNP